MPDLLHEDRHEEEHAEDRGADAQADQVGRGPVAGLQHPRRHQRVPRSHLDERERHQQDHRRRQAHDDLGASPVPDRLAVAERGRRLGQPVHQGAQAERAGDRAGQVELAAHPLRLADDPGRQQHQDQADRHVHEEHPAPVEVAGQQPAGDQPDRRAGDRHARVHAHRPVPLLALGEGDGDQRQRGGRGQRAADALDDPGGEQPRLVGGEAAGQRGEREQGDARDEDPAPSEQVAHPPAEQQQAAEGERVGVDDPLQVRPGEVQRVLDVRQRDVDDGRVEHDHQLRGRDDHEREPEPPRPPPACRTSRWLTPPPTATGALPVWPEVVDTVVPLT